MQTLSMRVCVCALAVGIAYGTGAAFSIVALVPISEGRPITGPLLVVLVLNGLLAVGVILLRRLTALLPDSSKPVVMGMTIGIMIIFMFYADDFSAVPMLLAVALLACVPIWIVYWITSKEETPSAGLDEQ